MNLNVAYPTSDYGRLEQAEIDERIESARSKLGRRLLILGHHYQEDNIIKHTDITGDSLALSRSAAATDADFIVFCGVHFMAETADLLTSPAQKVFMPNIDAGCSLADMAEINLVVKAWNELTAQLGDQVVPITYINSAIELKAFCGKNGGLVCTSSNAGAALDWAWNYKPVVFFFPDQHLGRNTAYRRGIPLEDMVLYQLGKPLPPIANHTRLILWNGFCCVHQEFDPFFFQQLKEKEPTVKVIVHPECNFAVTQLADYMGSTEYIIKTVAASAPGTIWSIATEINLVKRLQKQHPEITVVMPPRYNPRCRTMAMITPIHLLFQLENLVAGNYINQVVVPEELRADALIAVNRMLELVK